jgi:hypothetical protein
LLLSVLAAGCGEEVTSPRPNPYRPQTSPENVLHNFQVAYRQRDCQGYARLLAEDFRFYFDGETRELSGLPEFWPRPPDSLHTCLLFKSPEILDIRISLSQFSPQPVPEPGRERWRRTDVIDVFLEVDQAPRPGEVEVTTFRVDGQLQEFYFQMGKNAADTLATSPTSGLWFIVEWRDHGGRSGSGAELASQVEQRTTWSSIKSRYRVSEPGVESAGGVRRNHPSS